MSRDLLEALELLLWMVLSCLLFKMVLLREAQDRRVLAMGAPFPLPPSRDRILMSLVATRREEAPLRPDPWRRMDFFPRVHLMDLLLLFLLEPMGHHLRPPQRLTFLRRWHTLTLRQAQVQSWPVVLLTSSQKLSLS